MIRRFSSCAQSVYVSHKQLNPRYWEASFGNTVCEFLVIGQSAIVEPDRIVRYK